MHFTQRVLGELLVPHTVEWPALGVEAERVRTEIVIPAERRYDEWLEESVGLAKGERDPPSTAPPSS